MCKITPSEVIDMLDFLFSSFGCKLNLILQMLPWGAFGSETRLSAVEICAFVLTI